MWRKFKTTNNNPLISNLLIVVAISSMFIIGFVAFDDGYLNGSLSGYLFGYDDGFDDGYDEGFVNGTDEGYDDGYEEGYDDGYNDGSSDLGIASLNITISPDFFVNVTNDSGNTLNNTTWDIRMLRTTSIIIELNTINLLYDYCEENPTDSVNLTSAEELSTKLGINYTSIGMSLITFGESLQLFGESISCENSLISETFVIVMNHAIMPTFNIWIYANDTIFNGSDYTGEDETSAFGFCIQDFVYFIMSGLIVDNDLLQNTTIFRTYNENKLTIESLVLDVDGGTYEIIAKLNDEYIEIFSAILFG